jgi:primosomal protein N' (replication factor Y)
MYVLTIAPLTDGIPHEELTYFSKESVEPGDLVEAPIKKRTIKGLVLQVTEAREQKQELRGAMFGIRKISKILSKNYIHPLLFQGLKEVSSHTMIPLGKLIYDFLPEKLFAGKVTPLKEQKPKPGYDMLLLQHSYKDRLTRYKSIIRESFAKKQSIVFFFPTITDLNHAQNVFARGIEEYVVSMHSALTEKQWNTQYKILLENTHPLLILTTPSLLPWVRDDLGTIVIEREQSHYYYGHGEKYDMREVLIRAAKASRAKLILGAHLLSLNAHKALEQKIAQEVMPLQFRNDTPIDVVSMTDTEKVASPYLSKKALQLLSRMHKEKRGHYFFYAHRKGMYPTTICADCGTLFSCEKCDRPYVLHKIGGVRTFVCHECEHIIQMQGDSTLSCKHCGGWRLNTLGIATAGIEEELNMLGIPTFCIDGERTNTRTKVKKVYDAWKTSQYGVLIGTEMAHNVLEHADEIIVLSLDSMFSLPEYRTDEKILHLVTEMAEKVKGEGKVLLQTRLIKMPVMKYAKSHSFMEFYRDTLKERNTYHLPPYYVVIKTKLHNLHNDMRARLEEECKEFEMYWFEAGGGKTLLFLHIDAKRYEEDGILRDKLRAILSVGEVDINPLHFFSDGK